jgi:hypothetical protein
MSVNLSGRKMAEIRAFLAGFNEFDLSMYSSSKPSQKKAMFDKAIVDYLTEKLLLIKSQPIVSSETFGESRNIPAFNLASPYNRTFSINHNGALRAVNTPGGEPEIVTIKELSSLKMGWSYTPKGYFEFLCFINILELSSGIGNIIEEIQRLIDLFQSCEQDYGGVEKQVSVSSMVAFTHILEGGAARQKSWPVGECLRLRKTYAAPVLNANKTDLSERVMHLIKVKGGTTVLEGDSEICLTILKNNPNDWFLI